MADDGKSPVPGNGYIVLKQTEEPSMWDEVDATGIREAAMKFGDGVYVQVPRRSWKPKAATISTVRKVGLV